MQYLQSALHQTIQSAVDKHLVRIQNGGEEGHLKSLEWTLSDPLDVRLARKRKESAMLLFSPKPALEQSI